MLWNMSMFWIMSTPHHSPCRTPPPRGGAPGWDRSASVPPQRLQESVSSEERGRSGRGEMFTESREEKSAAQSSAGEPRVDLTTPLSGIGPATWPLPRKQPVMVYKARADFGGGSRVPVPCGSVGILKNFFYFSNRRSAHASCRERHAEV